MSKGKLVWDQSGEKLYETGVSKCVLFEVNNGESGNPSKAEAYGVKGVAWNGITGITDFGEVVGLGLLLGPGTSVGSGVFVGVGVGSVSIPCSSFDPPL